MAKKPTTGLSAAMLDSASPAMPTASELAREHADRHPGMGIKRGLERQPVSTTVKLDPALYKRLKAYCAEYRTNGQAVSVEALEAFLKAAGY